MASLQDRHAAKAYSLIYFLENIDSNHLDQLDKNSLIISLKPEVSLLLGNKGISYSILENFYFEKELRAHEEEYFIKQLGWFKEFDDFVKKQIEECEVLDIDLVLAHYNRLKYLIDSVILRAQILKNFLFKMQPEKIVYIRRKSSTEGDPDIYNFWRQDRTSYQEILLLIGKQFLPSLSIKLIEIETPLENKKKSEINKSNSAVQLPGKLTARNALKNFLHFIHYKKMEKWITGKKTLAHTHALFLDAGTHSIDEIIAELIHEGSAVFLKNQSVISRIDSTIECVVMKQKLNENDPQYLKLKDSFEKAYLKLEETNILNWINEQSSLDVHSLILPYFKTFLIKTCLSVLFSIEPLLSFYRKHQIQYVIARGSAGENYPAALLAAKIQGVKRICFQHGVDFTDKKDWVMDELGFFDVNFTMESSSCDYFKNQLNMIPNSTCKILESSHSLRKIETQYRKENLSRLKTRKQKRLIFYVPVKLAHGMMKFNSLIYPSTWYFEHQKKLLALFGERTDLNFVYKHSEHQSWAENSVLPWLTAQHFKNIAIKKLNFSKYLGKADAVILDGPTTVLFESAAAGLPVLNLYHEAMKPWPPMFHVFGKCLQRFGSTQEAIQQINSFLNGDPNEYSVDLPMSKTDDINYLKESHQNHFQTNVNPSVHV